MSNTEANQQLLQEIAAFFVANGAEGKSAPATQSTPATHTTQESHSTQEAHSAQPVAEVQSRNWQLLDTNQAKQAQQTRVIKDLVSQVTELLTPVYGQPETRSEDRRGWQYLWWKTSSGQYLHLVAKVERGVTLWALQPEKVAPNAALSVPLDYLEKLCLDLFALPWPVNAVSLVRFVRAHDLVALDECFAHYYLPQAGALGNGKPQPPELPRTHREENLLPAALLPPQLTFELQGDYPRGAWLRWDCPQAELVAQQLEARLRQKLVPQTLAWSVTAVGNQLEIKVLKELTSPDWERIRANRYTPRQALAIVDNLVAAENPLDHQQMQELARAAGWEQITGGECENYVTKHSSLGFPGAQAKYQAGRVSQVMFTYGASVYEERTGISSVQAPLLEAFTLAFGSPAVRKEYREYDFFYQGRQFFKRGQSTVYSFGSADRAKRVSLVVFPQLEIVVDYALPPAIEGEPASRFERFSDLPVPVNWVDALVVVGLVVAAGAGLAYWLS